MAAGDLWRHLAGELDIHNPAFDVILDRGTLATRIATAIGDSPSPSRMHKVYAELCDCLAAGKQAFPS
jgi:hypothetical protein